MIEDTDTWRTNDCGCRLQLSVWRPEDPTDIIEHMDMWVIREMCPPHKAHHDELQPILKKLMRGEPIDDTEAEIAKDVRYVDIPNDSDDALDEQDY